MRAVCKPWIATTALCCWAGLVLIGFLLLARYSSRPGLAAVRNDWPADSSLKRLPNQPTLVVFLHPRCPCSDATVAELARGLCGYRGAAPVHIVIPIPENAGDEWTATELVTAARSIPQADIVFDVNGVEAARFDAHVSGQVLLFDTAQRCVFDGGVTPSRAHEGDTAGRDLISDVMLQHQSPAQPLREAVFGCALYRKATNPVSIQGSVHAS